MVKTVKRKKAAVIMRAIVEEKPRTTKEFLTESLKQGITRSNFYIQLKNLQMKGKLTSRFSVKEKMQIWTAIGSREKADLKEIDLYLDEIENRKWTLPKKNIQQNDNNKSVDARLRDLGVAEFTHLCQTKLVTHDPRIPPFFQEMFRDPSYKDIREKILDAFKFVIARTLNDQNNKMLTVLLGENIESIKKLATSDPIKVKKRALYILALSGDTDALRIIYDLVKNSTEQDYSVIGSNIREIFTSYFSDYSIEIKRELYKIVVNKESSEGVVDRALKLLKDLSEDRLLISS